MSGIGDFIKKQRENMGLNITDLAELSGVSRPYLSQIESGKRNPSVDILNKIAGPLGVDTLTLMFHADYLSEEDMDNLHHQEKHEVDNYNYYDSGEIKNTEPQAINNLLDLIYDSVLNSSNDNLLSEVEIIMIKEHISEVLSNYEKLIERYLNSKVIWGARRKNFIEAYKDELTNEEIKKLFLKQNLDNELNNIKGVIDDLPTRLSKQPDFN